MAEAIRDGRCPSDRGFDAFLPTRIAAASHLYWTPVKVAARAAQWLGELGVQTLVDVGSGAGKFCVVGALCGRIRFLGVEQRAPLIAAARDLARSFGVGDQATFIHGTFPESQLHDADAYYFYNSFGENLFDAENCFDRTVELSARRYRQDVAAAEHLLRNARIGTCLLTYNGFGGSVPDGYVEVRADRSLPCILRMWQRAD